MTCEVIVMNRYGLAVAADSAVTLLSSDVFKISDRASKIYRLSDNAPAGITAYGRDGFMGAPWDALVGAYREQRGNKGLATLEEHARDFLEFLKNQRELARPEKKAAFVEEVTAIYLGTLLPASSQSSDDGDQHPTGRESVLSRLEAQEKRLKELPDGDAAVVLARRIHATHRHVIESVVVRVLGHLGLSTDDLHRLASMAAMHCVRDLAQSEQTNGAGIVLFGFGQRDLFPTCLPMHVSGIAAGQVCHLAEDPMSASYQQGVIRVFGHSTAASGFLDGIDPRLQESIVDGIQTKIQERLHGLYYPTKGSAELDILNDVGQDVSQIIDQRSTEKHGRLAIQVVAGLPLPELAELAEFLVSVERMKIKLSDRPAFVGGPIDVAVISRNSGFEWVKRKTISIDADHGRVVASR